MTSLTEAAEGAPHRDAPDAAIPARQHAAIRARPIWHTHRLRAGPDARAHVSAAAKAAATETANMVADKL